MIGVKLLTHNIMPVVSSQYNVDSGQVVDSPIVPIEVVVPLIQSVIHLSLVMVGVEKVIVSDARTVPPVAVVATL